MASSFQPTTSDLRLERCSTRPAHVSQSYQWDELLDVFVMLWPDMALRELMKHMEVYYRFRATQDQYKKKFDEWYSCGLLPPKKRRKEGPTRGKPEVIKTSSSLESGLLTLWSTPSRRESVSTTSAENFAVKEEDKQLVSLQKQIGKLNFSQQSQQEYIQQLGSLWDVHFDAEFGNAELIHVQDAVESMIEFLVDVTAIDPGLSTVATRPGDRGLLHLVSARIWRRYPSDDWLYQGLDYVTSVVPLPTEDEDEWRAYQDLVGRVPIFSEAAQDWEKPKQKSDTATSFIDSAQEWQKLERRRTNFGDVLIFCCRCGDGPYLHGVSVGCADCAGHTFCAECCKEQV